jgi:ATP-binding cassette subfamily G (WHITE) protein 2
MQVMKELGLEHIAHSKVGNAANRGISGGEQKRVAIALELVSSPSLLFLVRSSRLRTTDPPRPRPTT